MFYFYIEQSSMNVLIKFRNIKILFIKSTSFLIVL